jgi:UDP-N-acetylglucosamine--dolichyl-phosphate N-acetylglucosaminephosphotransferase
VIVYLIYIGVCIISYFATYELVGVVKPYNLKADLFGMDINKKGTAGGEKKIPESMGLVPAVMFLIIGCTATVLIKYLQKDMLVEHLAGLLSICFIIFLGFADDVLDLPWRYKIILPTIACLPILVAYTGLTQIIVPFPFD